MDSIIEPAIGRDILQLHPVSYPALLRQVFGLCVGHPAQVVSLNKLQGQLQDRGALATLQNYLELLGFGFLVSGIQKYSKSALRKRQSPPKLIVHDNALIRAFERPVQIAPNNQRLGLYLENAVGARLIEAGWNTTYWKDRDNEVDFIAEGPANEKLAIEVKWSTPHPSELKGLYLFCSQNPEFKPCVVCQESFTLKNITVIPAVNALSLSRQNRRLFE